MSSENLEDLLAQVRKIAFDLHVYLGNGYLENVYETGLVHRLQKAGIKAHSQQAYIVRDEDGTPLGEYIADLIVDGRLVVELKAVRAITSEHLSQTLNYLKVTGLPLGLIVNFGSYQFETRKVFPPTSKHA